MEILNCRVFKKWVSFSEDYVFRGGAKPVNDFPLFFKFHVYENANYINKPEIIIKKRHNLKIFSLGSFSLKTPWHGFCYESVHNFNQDQDITYFAKNTDILEIRNNEAIYKVNLNSNYHVGEVIFIMPNVQSENEDNEEYKILPIRIFLPKLNLVYIDSLNQFKISYIQNKNGLGMLDTENSSFTHDKTECFYFNKPFFIHVNIDTVQLLSVYITTAENYCDSNL